MAQKTNPVSLRLKINRNYDSFWWSSLFYSHLFDRDLAIRKHFDKVFRQTKKRSLGRLAYTGNSKKQKILTYWVRPDQVEKKSTLSFWRRRRTTPKKVKDAYFRSLPTQGKSLLNLTSETSNPLLQEKARLLRLLGLVFSSTLLNPSLKEGTYSKIVQTLLEHKALSNPSLSFSHFHMQKAFENLKETKNERKKRGTKINKKRTKKSAIKIEDLKAKGIQLEKLHRSINKSFNFGIENHLRRSFQIDSSITPFILGNPYLCAESLNKLITAQLRKRVFFKRIFGSIKRETQKLVAQGHLKGIRILVSGRLGRPEKAKRASLYIGRTSLNTFREKIDYSSSSALTRYGEIGVKVWVSF